MKKEILQKIPYSYVNLSTEPAPLPVKATIEALIAAYQMLSAKVKNHSLPCVEFNNRTAQIVIYYEREERPGEILEESMGTPVATVIVESPDQIDDDPLEPPKARKPRAYHKNINPEFRRPPIEVE